VSNPLADFPASNPSPLPVVALIRDLMFSSKVSATARAVGREVRIVRDAAQLATEKGTALIVDLALPGAIDAAAAWKQAFHGETIGFAAHVDTPTIAAAKAGGIDLVMTRGSFTSRLESLLKSR
jgi:hypothetical protein